MSKNWEDATGWDTVSGAGSGQAAARLAKNEKTSEDERAATRAAQVDKAVADAVEAARPSLDKIPDPVEPAGDGALTPEEQGRFAVCNDGIDLGNTAWFIQGKSLDTVAVGRLFRRTPHRLEPDRYYATIEEWAEVEKGISTSQCSKLRAAWELGEVLTARGYTSNPGQVREIVPVKNAYGLNSAVAVYVLVADTVGKDHVTATRLRETVKLLPGDLRLDEDDDPDALAKTIKGVLLGETIPPPAPAIPPSVRQAVDRRAVALANVLDRGRIPRSEVQLYLLQAFADEEDTTVFDAVLARMEQSAKESKES